MNHAQRFPGSPGTGLHRTAHLAPKFFAALAALALLGACEKPAMPAFERPPSPVTVAAAVKQDVPQYLDEIGKCVPRESVSIVPQVSGRITEIHFVDGADVKKGDLLFTIDPRPFQAKLEAAQATQAQAKAALALARQELARISSVSDPAAVSQSDRDVKRNAVDVAEALALSAQSAFEMATLDLEYCTIRAPIDGRTGHRLVDAGNVVVANAIVPNAGSTLLVIERLDPVYAEFTITEGDLTVVQKNMAAGKLSVEVRLPDDPADARAGDLTFLDNSVLGSTGTVRLRATVPNADHRFWPGRFVKIRLVLSTIPGAVIVPASAPQLSAKGPFVYVVKEDGTAELRPVVQGQRHGDSVVVEHGLEAGEKVVIDGQIGVMPGGKVRVVEPAAAQSANQGAPTGAADANGAKEAAKPAPAKSAGGGS
jgi:multidrug efflux system membrane fusion protein